MEKSDGAIRSADDPPSEDVGRQISGIAFPAYTLADSIAVANAVHNKGGGYATREQVAAFLQYKSTSNGAFLARVGSAKIFGLLIEENKTLRLSPLATKILMPESDEERRAGLVEAFFNVPLFKAIYDEYRGKDLPEGLGLKNALRNKFRVVPTRIDTAFRSLFESAETAGFFETRGGSRTQLIMPVLRSAYRSAPKTEPVNDRGDGGGAGGPGNTPPTQPPPTSRPSLDDVAVRYINALIDKMATKEGDEEKELMERIERLISGKG